MLLAGLHTNIQFYSSTEWGFVRLLSPLSQALCLPLVPFAHREAPIAARVDEAGLDALGGEHPLGRRLSCDTAC